MRNVVALDSKDGGFVTISLINTSYDLIKNELYILAYDTVPSDKKDLSGLNWEVVANANEYIAHGFGKTLEWNNFYQKWMPIEQ